MQWTYKEGGHASEWGSAAVIGALEPHAQIPSSAVRVVRYADMFLQNLGMQAL